MGPCQRAAERAGLGCDFQEAGEEPVRIGKASRVSQVKVLRIISKAKRHKSGPKPETQPTGRVSELG